MRIKPSFVIGAAMLGIAGTGVTLVLTHYHPPKNHVLAPKNPSGRVFSSASVRKGQQGLRPIAPAKPAAATKQPAAATGAAGQPDAGAPAHVPAHPGAQKKTSAR